MGSNVDGPDVGLSEMQGYIDTSSIYEVACTLSFTEPDNVYPWAWGAALIVTGALISSDHLTFAPAPEPMGTASGLFGVLVSSLHGADVVSMRSDPSRTIVTGAVRDVTEWAAEHPEAVRQQLEILKQDKQNGVQWMESAVRFKWPEHMVRFGGLIDDAFIPPIANVLETSVSDLERLRIESRRPEVVRRYSTKQPAHDEAFLVTRDAFFAACILRGEFHEAVAKRMGWQLLRHPFRNPLGYHRAVGSQALSESHWWFSTILLAKAFGSSPDPERRVRTWANEVITARRARKMGKLILEDSGVRQDDQAIAIDAAARIGLGMPPKWVDKAADVGIGLGVGALTLHAGELAALVVGTSAAALSAGLEPTRRGFDKLRRSGLERLIKVGPKSVDICNFR